MSIRNLITIFSLGLLFFIINFIPVEASSWADPGCAPPGCNRPEPITVEGGTILEGYNLTVQGTNSNTVINTSGIIAGGKITAQGATDSFMNAFGDLQIMQCEWIVVTNPQDQNYPGYSSCEMVSLSKLAGNIFLDNIAIANQGLLLGPGQSIYGIAGDSSIQITEGMGGVWGYGVFAQAHAVSRGNLDKDTIGVWGKAAVSDGSEYSYGIYGQGAGNKTYGIYATNDSADSYALVASNVSGGGAAYLVGDVDITGGILAVDRGSVLGLSDTTGGIEDALIVNGDTTIRVDHFIEGRTSAERDFKVISTFADENSGRGLEYTSIRVRSTEPNKVYFGESSGSGIEICLNNDCISNWPSGSGGGHKFVTIHASAGSDPVADAGDDTLNFIAGRDIDITGDAAVDSITIAVEDTLDSIQQINGYTGGYLTLNGDDSYGVRVYDKLTVNGSGGLYVTGGGLSSDCEKITTDRNGKLTCGTDAVNDADYSTTNELQTLQQVTDMGADTDRTVTVGELCIAGTKGATCLTQEQLDMLLQLLN